jgi:uncharacterized protein
VIKRLLRLVVVVLLAIGGTLWLRQPGMVFYPIERVVATPSDWGLSYEKVKLITADGVGLYGWYLPAPNTRRTLLFFHGNGGNISHRGESLQIFHRLGLNVLIIDYRGYGRSEGSPSEEGLYRDAEAAWRYLVEKRGLRAEDIVIFGRSLGGAVAAWLAAKEQPAGLILESTFSSAREMAHAVFPLLSWLTPMRYEFNTAAVLKHVHCPILIAHSRDDEIIPFAFGEVLYQAANTPKRFLMMRGDHNAGFLQSQSEYEHGLRLFFAESVTVGEDVKSEGKSNGGKQKHGK